MSDVLTQAQKNENLARSIEIQKGLIEAERDSYRKDTLRRVLVGWENELLRRA